MKRVLVLACLPFSACLGFAETPFVPELKSLEWMIGEWRGQATLWLPGQQSIAFECWSRNSWTLGGRYLQTAYTSNVRGLGRIDGLALLSFDPAAKSYRHWSFSSVSHIPREQAGVLEGERLVTVSKPYDPGLGEAQTFRSTYTRKSTREVHYLEEFKIGDRWERIMETTFVRK